MRLPALLLLAACAAPLPDPPPPAMQLRAALPVRVDGVLYELRRTAGGVAVAGLRPDAPGQEAIARAAIRRLCGQEPGAMRAAAGELVLAIPACPALDG